MIQVLIALIITGGILLFFVLLGKHSEKENEFALKRLDLYLSRGLTPPPTLIVDDFDEWDEE